MLTGPVAVTFAQIADMISASTGRQVGTREITPADLRRQLEQRGMARWEAEHFEEMYQLFRDGRSEFVSGDAALPPIGPCTPSGGPLNTPSYRH